MVKKRTKGQHTEIAIADKFVPRFWDGIDRRFGIVKEIRRRYRTLKADADADCIQKDMLVQRAIFIGVQLETMEVKAAESGEFEPGVYTQMVNCLMGLLRALGLERKRPNGKTLQGYLNDRDD